MIVHDELEQGSPAWHEMRLGRVGGSECASFLSTPTKPGQLPAGVVSLAYMKAAELLTGETQQGYVSAEMEWGTLQEPIARAYYEQNILKGKVHQVGYISAGRHFGFSPDGINDKFILEIKCPSPHTALRFFHTEEVSKEHFAQVQWGMWLTGLKKAVYFVYCPAIPGVAKAINVYADPAAHALFDIREKMYVELFKEIAKL